jgi:hypothetical protein
MPPLVRALALGCGLLAATAAAAQDPDRRGGWADEVKRSLDRPNDRPVETTGSGGPGREAPKSKPNPGMPLLGSGAKPSQPR